VVVVVPASLLEQLSLIWNSNRKILPLAAWRAEEGQ
jgi:hypothetical protein